MKIHRQRFPKNNVRCTGYLLTLNLVGREEIIERILEAWEPGCLIYQKDELYIFLLPYEKNVNVEEAIGQVLMKSGAYVTNIILTDIELENIKQAAGSLILLYQGEQLSINLGECKWIDPLDLVNLSVYRYIQPKPLGLAPKPAADNAELIKERDVRSVFKDDKYQVSDDQVEMLTALKQKVKRFKVSKKSTDSTGRSNSLSHHAKRNTPGLFRKITQLFFNPATTGRNDDASSLNHQSSFKPGRFSLGQRISSMIMSSRLGLVIGRQQAKYVKKMMDMFEHGDIDDALKHAIPLNDMKEALENKAPSMFSPSIRNNLSIQTGRQGSEYSYNLGGDFFDHLRSLYEKTFKRLDTQGKYADAAFVLAELLNDIERALDYLEKHKQFQLAAELAEGRQVTPARVIRQWIIAGNAERAMYIANFTGCYTEAITLLERNHKKEAAQLRQLFAIKMADAGDYERAVDIAWPVPELRTQALQWLDLAIEAEGVIGAKMLIRKLTYEPATINRYKVRLKTIYENTDDKYLQERNSILQEIFKTTETSNLSVICRLSLKSYVRDCAQGLITYNKNHYNRLLAMSDDISLRTDLKSLSLSNSSFHHSEKLLESEEIWEISIKSAGQYVIFDAVLLTKNRYLIALGEAGVHIINSAGKIQQAFKVPCHKIIISDQLNRAILLARRDMILSLTLLDLNNYKVTRWIELPAGVYPDTFDGMTWYIAGKQELTGLDVQSADVTPVWHVHDLPGDVASVLRDASNLLMLMALDDDNFEMWRYQLPAMSLRERTPVQTELVSAYDFVALRMDGAMLGFNYQDTENKQTLITLLQTNVPSIQTKVDIEGSIISIKYDMHWLVICSEISANDFSMYFINCRSNSPDKIRLIVKGQSLLNMRLENQHCIVYDTTGRVMHIDLMNKEIIADI